jgi:hypothetical protein
MQCLVQQILYGVGARLDSLPASDVPDELINPFDRRLFQGDGDAGRSLDHGYIREMWFVIHVGVPSFRFDSDAESIAVGTFRRPRFSPIALATAAFRLGIS